MVTEFGAEANREGSVEDKGTYAFQQDFANFHLGVFATKPWLSGALYWAINEFRVRRAGTAATRARSRRSTRRRCCTTATRPSPRGRTCGATTPRRSSTARERWPRAGFPHRVRPEAKPARLAVRDRPALRRRLARAGRRSGGARGRAGGRASAGGPRAGRRRAAAGRPRARSWACSAGGRCRPCRRRPRPAASTAASSPSAGTSRTGDAERHRDQVERAEDEHQLGIGRHRPLKGTRPGAPGMSTSLAWPRVMAGSDHRHSRSPRAPSRARAPRAACASRGSFPASSTAAARIRSPSRSTR